jgi:glutamate-1-semialdehyde 2,1-aminomutase
MTYGKVAGGGLPIGVVAGKAEVMDVLAPAPPERGPLLFGTFTANPYTMAAGLAYLKAIDDEVYEDLSAKGDRLRAGIAAAVEELGVNARVTGTESAWGVHMYGADGLTTMREIMMDADTMRLGSRLAEELRVEGVLVHTPLHIGFLCSAHTDEDIDALIEAHRVALRRVRDEERSAGNG